MRLKPGVSDEIRQAVQAFQPYLARCTGSTGRVVRCFCREQPTEAKVLVEFFDAMHPGLNHLASRMFTRTATKLRFALEDARETEGESRRWGGWMRRHRLLFTVVTLVLILPMVLSPTHPIAVYVFLAESYHPSLTPVAFASSGTDLPSFLVSPAQVRRYKTELREDMLDRRSGGLFVIVRCLDGTLQQEDIRTWNGFLPASLPVFLSNWLDRKELPFLGDEVDTWLRGNEIIAMGHYHAFGGPPSAGDTHAQWFSGLPEVVVVNGVVPMIYLNGHVISYGVDVVVSDDVFRSLRTLELSLTMDGTQNFSWSEEPSETLTSFLGFLRDYENVDISRKDHVARGIRQLCLKFKDDYRSVFTEGFILAPYENDPGRSNFLGNLQSLHGWAETHKWTPPAIVDGAVKENPS